VVLERDDVAAVPHRAAGNRHLLLVGALALAVRVIYILGWKHPDFIGGDAYWYHYGAQLLVDGHGFIDAYRYKNGIVAGTADHPPMTILVLAAGDLVGLNSFFWQQLFMAVVGSGTVVVLAITAARLAGRRAGIIAGVIGAIYPNLWFNDAMVMSETLIQFTTALAVLSAYWWWSSPSTRRSIVLGVAVAACALTRAEAVLFVPLLAAPLILLDKRLVRRDRLIQFAISAVVAGLVLAPWVGYNLTRFNEPVTISTGFDPTAAVSNCNKVFYGPLLGYWWRPCILADPLPPKGLDVPGQEAFYRRIAIKYMEAHESRLPVVVVARVARTWALFRPVQQIRLDQIETREFRFSVFGLSMYYVLLVGTVGGVWVLRRRRQPVSPILATIGTVTFATAITFGQTRYRAAAEVVLVLAAAVALAGLLERSEDPVT
jgi:4-amino-4-deoxy-L-arabinose transferase-like glycosyltransferase